MGAEKQAKEKSGVLSDKEKFAKKKGEEKLEHMGERSAQAEAAKSTQSKDKK
jgi:hypothetical protein